jgi:hypothetical protein
VIALKCLRRITAVSCGGRGEKYRGIFYPKKAIGQDEQDCRKSATGEKRQFTHWMNDKISVFMSILSKILHCCF